MNEKKFNLDGPDNWKTWMEEKTNIYLNKRLRGGGSIVVWGMPLPAGKIFVKKVTGMTESDEFIETLRQYSIPNNTDQLETILAPTRQLQRACFVEYSGVSLRSWHRSAAVAKPTSGPKFGQKHVLIDQLPSV